MDHAASPLKKLKSPLEGIQNTKTAITCSNVPEGLFDATAVKKHFSKFGRVQRIRLFPKRQMCIIEYDHINSVERAILNAGAFDGFMFDVTRTKPRIRRKSKREDDPDWVPDSDVEEELSAMGGVPTYRVTRQKPMEKEAAPSKHFTPIRAPKKVSPIKAVIKKKTPVQPKQTIAAHPKSEIESPVGTTQTSMSTIDAATELYQLRFRVSLTPEEQWRTLDARDRILRAWGGAGARVKVGGATIGTCPDMCPEKERLHRQAEYQVMTLETVPGTDGQMAPHRAVKQYSRSSADQEMPMCYELRPARVLMATCLYLLREVADTDRQVTLADWFHFMWDRLRGIRKDITQQALCCAEIIHLVEMCARFHAHCAARLADLEHTQFDQKLNTDNLTKCLQTLKHMYTDVRSEKKPREAEFRGYIALLNLGDSNFWWEIKQLPQEIQKSEAIIFAIKVFNALDNNNYVRFFRLVRDKATYLQACILLRYFNDVRARALARMVKAFSPRGGARYPAKEVMNALAFESVENMKSFISHYGLRFGKTDDSELSVILDRNQFIEDSDPYPTARSIQLIESKRQCAVGEVIAGGPLPQTDFSKHKLYTSFNKDGTLREPSLIAEDQNYDTANDTNKNIQSLKTEIQRLSQGGRVYTTRDRSEKGNVTLISEVETKIPQKSSSIFAARKAEKTSPSLFSFKPAISVAPIEVFKSSPEKVFENNKSVFSFSKPQNSIESLPNNNASDTGNLFDNKTLQFKNTEFGTSVFSRGQNINRNTNIFAKKENEIVGFSKGSNIFAKANESQQTASNLFGAASKTNVFSTSSNIFNNAASKENVPKSLFTNGDTNNLSPGSLFKSAVLNAPKGSDSKGYSIFQSKTKSTPAAENMLNTEDDALYDFGKHETQEQLRLQRLHDNKMLEMKRKQDEDKQKELKRQEQERLKQEEQKKLEELRVLEEQRIKEEERKQEEYRLKKEEERKTELERKAEEERKFKEIVENESIELIEEFVKEVGDETVNTILKEELDNFNGLMSLAETLTNEIVIELCSEICYSEMKAEMFWTTKLKKKWFYVWRKHFVTNLKRRTLLEDTPVWLAERSPVEEATNLRRTVEKVALKHMNAIHRGYKFTGELNTCPHPEPYNVMEIIKSSLLKRMKRVNYPYDKCFFWKVTLVSPGPTKWLLKKIDVESWILDVFSDKKKHVTSESLIQVVKQSWNYLMDFAISVSLTNQMKNCNEAMEGTNGLLFYTTEKEQNFVDTVKETIKQKYPYQVIPVGVIMPKMIDPIVHDALEMLLINYVSSNIITDFKIFVVDSKNINDSLNECSRRALKWLAKHYPPNPALEIDHLKSICQRYLGNEIWYMLKTERDNRMNVVLRQLNKLIECYNIALDKLTSAITDEDLFNYSSFPLEFKEFLDNMSSYPKPYEFIPSSVRNSDNIAAIKCIMGQLRLPNSEFEFHPLSVSNMQAQIRTYCKQIGWFEDPEEVLCKIVAVLPSELCNVSMPSDDFTKYLEQYDLIDVLNVIVYEKINRLYNFDNRHAVYKKSELDNYRSFDWLYDTAVLKNMKHKASNYEDELDMFIQAKRRKLELDSLEYLMLEDKDCTLVEENIKAKDESISHYSDCKNAIEQLEQQLEQERQKSIALENMLKSALCDM